VVLQEEIETGMHSDTRGHFGQHCLSSSSP